MDTLPSLVNHQHTRSVLEYGKRGTTRQEAQCSNRRDADMARSQDKDRNGAKGTWVIHSSISARSGEEPAEGARLVHSRRSEGRA